jgi:hypothetical protein
MMSNSTIKQCAVLLACAPTLAWVWFGARAQAQTVTVGAASDFNRIEHFDPPNQAQIKSRITGTEALPQSNGCYLIKQLKLETFRVTGEREIIVEAPECLYDSPKRLASSPGHLRVKSGDERFQVEGEGFFCDMRPDKSTLTISNRVQTVIRDQTTIKPQP